MPDQKTYLQMVREAICALQERGGSSRQSIKKYIHANYLLENMNADRLINNAISKGVQQRLFVQPKGPSGPVKLSKKVSKCFI